jgi:hypothetical protein
MNLDSSASAEGTCDASLESFSADVAGIGERSGLSGRVVLRWRTVRDRDQRPD